MNTQEILDKHLARHATLGFRKDAQDKDEFDQEHRQIWNECDQELRERLTELQAEEHLTPELEQELTDLQDSLD